MKIFKKIFYIVKFYAMYVNKKREMNDPIDNFADKLVLNSGVENAVIPKRIWMYWEGELPDFVVVCIESIRKKNPNHEVNFLNKETIKDFSDVDYEQFPSITPQQKADLIRFELIYQYGGIWLDASILVYENLDWIQSLIVESKTESFAYYRAKNTTKTEFPVLENWLLASVQYNIFFKYWFDELLNAIEITPKAYIEEIRKMTAHPDDYFQRIGNLEYLVAYVACQKVMRVCKPSITLINCDKNAFYYQVKNQWVKEKVLIDFAINYPPIEQPKLLKLAGKERKILAHYFSKKMYFKGSFIDIS